MHSVILHPPSLLITLLKGQSLKKNLEQEEFLSITKICERSLTPFEPDTVNTMKKSLKGIVSPD